MAVKHNNFLKLIIGCLCVGFFGLHVSVILMTIIRSVRAKEIAWQRAKEIANTLPADLLSIKHCETERSRGRRPKHIFSWLSPVFKHILRHLPRCLSI
jgi:hypothetical protein